MTDRRSFLRGLIAAPAIVAASSLMPVSARLLADWPPKLWGDGIHDDTAALQWLMDNFKGPVKLQGSYKVSGLIIPHNVHLLGDSSGVITLKRRVA